MIIKELWTEEDAARVVATQRAFSTGDLAGALLAVEGAGEKRADETRRRLERWSERVDDRRAVPGVSAIDALRRVLVNELHISGEYEDPHNPRNCALSLVVATRSGLPILVSSVWMLVGRLAGIEVEGIGLPGHFIVRIGGDQGEYVDAFRFGRVLNLEQVREIVSRHGNADEGAGIELVASSDEAIVERVLRNLSRTYLRLDDHDNVYRVARMLVELWPESSEHSLNYARLCDEVGAHELAETTYRDVLARFDGTREAMRAKERLAGRNSPRFSN